ncbi:MAG: M23 family metallopeptidase [Spirochaetaceae bacterium]|jgi:murein DD-endopeptidase MepM/ murein hydrolase activator NlpD|nr:M23 family metallopeptidase [Spirochaetaceae bacterium]
MNKTGWLLLLVLTQPFAAADTPASPYPGISRLDPQDISFRQYLADVEASRRALFNPERGGAGPEGLAETLTIYTYTPGAGEDIFGLAARCNIPYPALVTLNRLAHPDPLENTGPLLLPSIPGIFIPESPETDLERIMASARTNQTGVILTLDRKGRRERFRFIPGADFTATERIFFLNRTFRFPLRTYRLTSGFGVRISPITGTPRYHEGLDLAAPEGSGVFAARDGVVSGLGEDPVYGKYIIIEHGENWTSLYGHLSAITTTLRSAVRSGTLIGRVGSTGQSTGPHLHFELRQNGRAQDPGRFLSREGMRE